MTEDQAKVVRLQRERTARGLEHAIAQMRVTLDSYERALRGGKPTNSGASTTTESLLKAVAEYDATLELATDLDSLARMF